MLRDESAIAPEIITTRGYFTATRKAELENLGFSPSQRQIPALVIPIWNVWGTVEFYQIRPDEPRIKKAKPLKYEFPAGVEMAIDVHPSVREQLRDPTIPLFITEGTKKADSAVSRGLCCIALLGVWNWRGRNEYGGKMALPDWDGIALNGRKCYIVFDSDVMTKSSVAGALVRLKDFLQHRGGRT